MYMLVWAHERLSLKEGALSLVAAKMPWRPAVEYWPTKFMTTGLYSSTRRRSGAVYWSRSPSGERENTPAMIATTKASTAPMDTTPNVPALAFSPLRASAAFASASASSMENAFAFAAASPSCFSRSWLRARSVRWAAPCASSTLAARAALCSCTSRRTSSAASSSKRRAAASASACSSSTAARCASRLARVLRSDASDASTAVPASRAWRSCSSVLAASFSSAVCEAEARRSLEPLLRRCSSAAIAWSFSARLASRSWTRSALTIAWFLSERSFTAAISRVCAAPICSV
mmetsp:Transcript_25304/g.60477  ORF Transcript_25304/g.60477 Transcript_25304/m.60477 type:complete len:290 (-) Transcript_25304:981-1850(-)